MRSCCTSGLMVAMAACAAPAHADIVVSDTTVARTGAAPTRATVFSFDPKTYRMQVMATGSQRTTHMRSNVGIAVRDASQLPAIGTLMRREVLLVNGGFSGSHTDVPVGLLIANGKAAAAPQLAMIPAKAQANCPLAARPRYRLSGVLCVTPAGSLSIGPLDQVPYEQCTNAIQAGPLLVEDGQVGVCPAEADERPYARTVVCTDAQQARVIVAEPITLHDLAVALARAPAQGGLGCRQAINLSGDTSTGALHVRPASSLKRPKLHGPGSFPVPSFFIVSRL